METLELYIVRDYEGKYYPNKKYQGFDWAKDIKDARILDKLPTARTVVTQVLNNYPNEPAPVILKLTATVTEIMAETERIKKAQQKIVNEKEARKVRDAMYNLEYARKQLEKAEADLADAKRKIDSL